MSKNPLAAIANREKMGKFRGETMARLLAQEWVRNGMNISKAYETVFHGRKAHSKSISTMTGNHMDAFVDEVRNCVEKAGIEKDAALNFLWSVVQSSVLDYLDEHGKVLSVKELKKLPRVMQQLIHKITVKTFQSEVKDKDGNLQFDDNGRPYVKENSVVEIEIIEKVAAIKQLALIMKWVGPASVTQINNTVNVYQYMAAADEQARKLNSLYEKPPIDVEVRGKTAGPVPK